MTSGIFAIVGVTLGAVLTYLMQSRIARRAEDFSRDERLRGERMEVYSAFAESAMEARRAQINRWYQRRDMGRGTEQYEAAKGDSYHARSTARRERYRVELVASAAPVSSLAEEVVRSLGSIHKATSKLEMEERAEQTLALIERFVAAAATQLEQSPTP